MNREVKALAFKGGLAMRNAANEYVAEDVFQAYITIARRKGLDCVDMQDELRYYARQYLSIPVYDAWYYWGGRVIEFGKWVNS